MKKQITIYLFPCLIMAIPFACKKDDNTTTTKKSQCRIITMTRNDGGIVNITYNSDNKIAETEEIFNGSDIIGTYQYSGNIVIISYSDNSGQQNFAKRTITLNQDGRIANDKYLVYNGGSNDWSNNAYVYSGNEVIKSTQTSSDGGTPTIVTFTWTNGNLTSIKRGSNISNFDYYKGKPAKSGTFWDWERLRSYSGFPVITTKNALKSQTIGSVIHTYSYTYDKEGKVAAMTELFNSYAIGWTYQYQCN